MATEYIAKSYDEHRSCGKKTFHVHVLCHLLQRFPRPHCSVLNFDKNLQTNGEAQQSRSWWKIFDAANAATLPKMSFFSNCSKCQSEYAALHIELSQILRGDLCSELYSCLKGDWIKMQKKWMKVNELVESTRSFRSQRIAKNPWRANLSSFSHWADGSYEGRPFGSSPLESFSLAWHNQTLKFCELLSNSWKINVGGPEGEKRLKQKLKSLLLCAFVAGAIWCSTCDPKKIHPHSTFNASLFDASSSAIFTASSSSRSLRKVSELATQASWPLV